MKKITIILFILFLLGVCHSRQMQIPIQFVNSPTTIELYNLKGQRILKREFSSYSTAPISLSNNLANQIYIMRVINGNRVSSHKFMPNTQIRFVGNFVNTNNASTNETARNPQIQLQNLLRSAPLGDSITNIIFINGMMNTEEAARINLRHIRNAYEDILSTHMFPGDYIFRLGFNETRGRIGDAAEILFQWETEFGQSPSPLQWLAPIISEEYYEEAMGFSANNRNITTNTRDNVRKFIDRVAETMRRLDIETVTKYHAQTTNYMRAIIDNSFENNHRVIIIAHSQGNLYANELIAHYRQNDTDYHLNRAAVLNIAPPTASPSTSWWFTNRLDWTIIGVRARFWNTLPGFDNWVINSNDDPREWSQHSFWESYFHPDLRSRQLIDSVFFKYAKELPFAPIYHSHDVAQINRLIKYNGLQWEYNNPESWNTGCETKGCWVGEICGNDYWRKGRVFWTDDATYKRIIDLHVSDALFGDISLDLPKIIILRLVKGQISSLDLSKCVNLVHLTANSNQITSLNLSNNTALWYMEIGYNRLTSLDLSNNTALRQLYIGNNQLTSLDLSNNKELTHLSIDNNLLTSLDLSNNTKIVSCHCVDNPALRLCP